MKKLSSQIIVLFLLSFLATCIVSAQAKDITIGQKNKTFIFDGKKVEEITIDRGDTVNFLNNDLWFHNIYSLSQAKTFDQHREQTVSPATFQETHTNEVQAGRNGIPLGLVNILHNQDYDPRQE